MWRGLPILGSATLWALAGALGWQVMQAHQIPLPDPRLRPVAALQGPAGQTAEQTALPDEAPELSEALARPLFAPDRRPSATENAIGRAQELQPIAEKAKPDTLPVVIVYGVALTSRHAKALLSINDSVPDWYGEKDIIAGWTLTKIENSGVLLQSGTSELRIELY